MNKIINKKKTLIILGSVVIVIAITIGLITANNQSIVSEEVPNEPEKIAETMAGQMKNEKDEIVYKMQNAPYFYEAVKGDFIKTINTADGETKQNVEYAIDYEKDMGYSKVNLSTGEETIITVDKDFVENYITASDGTKQFMKMSNGGYSDTQNEVNSDYKKAMSTIDRVDKQDGEINALYYVDPVPTASSISTFPQQVAVMCLSDQNTWNAVPSVDFERESYLVEGSIPKNMSGAKSTLTDTFKLVVDKETGILFSYEVYDSDGNIYMSLYTKNIEIQTQKMMDVISDLNELKPSDVQSYKLIEE